MVGWSCHFEFECCIPLDENESNSTKGTTFRSFDFCKSINRGFV